MTDPKPPERVCANCDFYQPKAVSTGTCVIGRHLPPVLRLATYGLNDPRVFSVDTCVLFRAREES